MFTWAACLKTTDSDAVACLRLLPGIESAEAGEVVWLRGPNAGKEVERALAKLPVLRRFELLADGRLKPAGSRIPQGTLPALEWRPLKQAMTPALPPAALAGVTRQKVSLTLVRSGAEQQSAGLMTGWDTWAEFAIRAPAIRLKPLVFAAADDGQVLVLGHPLPALPGLQLAGRDGILVPAGYTWSPPVEAPVLRELLNLNAGDFAILSLDGTQQAIRAEQLIPASRSAVRSTAGLISV